MRVKLEILKPWWDGDRVHPGEYFEAIQERIAQLSKGGDV